MDLIIFCITWNIVRTYIYLNAMNYTGLNIKSKCINECTQIK